jgi:hypothetical protein
MNNTFNDLKKNCGTPNNLAHAHKMKAQLGAAEIKSFQQKN